MINIEKNTSYEITRRRDATGPEVEPVLRVVETGEVYVFGEFVATNKSIYDRLNRITGFSRIEFIDRTAPNGIAFGLCKSDSNPILHFDVDGTIKVRGTPAENIQAVFGALQEWAESVPVA